MRPLVRALPFLAMLFGAPLAAADDYPVPLIDRPLALEPSTFQAMVAFDLYHNGAVVDPAPSNTEALTFGADYGILRHLQVGAAASVVVSPDSAFGYALASGQYEFFKFAAIRIDIGATKDVDTHALFGVGLPVRLKLTDIVAFVSGRPYAWAAEDDILSAHLGNGSTTEFRVPLGILVELTPRISAALRSGIRKVDDAFFVPLGVDVMATTSRVDIGVMFDVNGQVSPDMAPGYFDLLRFRVFAQLRI